MVESSLLPGAVPRPAVEVERYRQLGLYTGDTLFSILERGHHERGQHIALVSGPERISYSELYFRVERRAAFLERMGITELDRVVLQLPNVASFVEILFALFRIGAIPIMALPGHRLADLRYFCEHASATLYIAPTAHGGFDYRPLGRSLGERAPRLKVLHVAGDGTWDSAQTEVEETPSGLPTDPGQIALLQLSGGSTGTPKLIPRTHEDYLYSVRRSAEVCGLGPDSVYLAALPAAHNFPLSSPGILGCFWALGTVVLSPNPSPDSVFPLLTSENVTITAAVPALARAWLEAAEARQVSFRGLQVLQVGGARLEEAMAQRLVERFGCTLQQVFGMAEGLVNYTRLDDPLEVITSTQGQPMSPYDEVRVVDDHDQDVEPGEEGHLLTRGPYTVRGYYKAPEHNSRAFTEDGFYRTGDIVRMTRTGHLIVTGRAKEQINRAGEKIAPAEVEEHLNEHTAIREAAILGVPDERLGEKIVAFVVQESGAALRRHDLLNFLRDRGLATFKMPDQVVLVHELPRTSVGKIDKVALAKDLA